MRYGLRIRPLPGDRIRAEYIEREGHLLPAFSSCYFDQGISLGFATGERRQHSDRAGIGTLLRRSPDRLNAIL